MSDVKPPDAPEARERVRPRYQPLERFWPFADFSEEYTDDELAAMDPELRVALFGRLPRPFSVTLVFPRFEGPDYERAIGLARASAEYLETGTGPSFRHRARFYPGDVLTLRALFEIVGRFDACQVLVDDAPIPYARELWLPLFWYLITRTGPDRGGADPTPA
jgi:hypothetical protein